MLVLAGARRGQQRQCGSSGGLVRVEALWLGVLLLVAMPHSQMTHDVSHPAVHFSWPWFGMQNDLGTVFAQRHQTDPALPSRA